MKKATWIVAAALALGTTAPVLAQAPAQGATRAANLEARVIKDSTGCPSAIELWLSSTTDTIQGLEVVLHWDRPGRVEFQHGVPASKAAPTDSLSALLKPADPSTQIPLERAKGLLSKWEFVEARATVGNGAKIMGVAKLFGQDEPSPLLPGASGSLLRIPVRVLSPVAGAPADTGGVNLTFDTAGTRLSTHRGVLFGTVALKGTALDPGPCR